MGVWARWRRLAPPFCSGRCLLSGCLCLCLAAHLCHPLLLHRESDSYTYLLAIVYLLLSHLHLISTAPVHLRWLVQKTSFPVIPPPLIIRYPVTVIQMGGHPRAQVRCQQAHMLIREVVVPNADVEVSLRVAGPVPNAKDRHRILLCYVMVELIGKGNALRITAGQHREDCHGVCPTTRHSGITNLQDLVGVKFRCPLVLRRIVARAYEHQPAVQTKLDKISWWRVWRVWRR